MKTENECRDGVQHTVRILATLGADRVNERQADARRRPRAEYGSRQSSKPASAMRAVSTPGSVNAKSTTGRTTVSPVRAHRQAIVD
jgi:hypothetical protein